MYVDLQCVLIIRIQGEDLKKRWEIQGGGGGGVETPIGAMLWNNRNIVLCFMVNILCTHSRPYYKVACYCHSIKHQAKYYEYTKKLKENHEQKIMIFRIEI